MNYTVFLKRILEILQADQDLKKKVLEFRLGDLGDSKDNEKNARAYPLVYVTTATNPIVSRKSKYSQGDVNKLPGQVLELEFWVIVVASTTTPAKTQEQLYEISGMVEKILENNIQLRKPSNQSDSLCATSDIFPQRRLEKYRGHLIEAMTIRIRPTVFVTY